MDPSLVDTTAALLPALPAVTDLQSALVALSFVVAWALGWWAKHRTREGSALRQILPVATQYIVAVPVWLGPGILAHEHLPQLAMRLVLGIGQGAASGGIWSQGRAMVKAKQAAATPLLGR